MSEAEAQRQISQRAERVLSHIVMSGAVISVALFAFGISVALGNSSIVDEKQTMSLDSIVSSISSMDSMGLIALGVLTVIATPLVRILATILYFAKKDRLLMVLPIVTFILIVVGFVIRM